jgi:hypothetical protein
VVFWRREMVIGWVVIGMSWLGSRHREPRKNKTPVLKEHQNRRRKIQGRLLLGGFVWSHSLIPRFDPWKHLGVSARLLDLPCGKSLLMSGEGLACEAQLDR